MKNSYIISLLSLFIVFTKCSKEESSGSNQVNQNNNPEEQVVKYNVNISSSEGGTVNTSSGSYIDGTVLNIQANPNVGYVFIGWEGFDSTNPSITINVSQNYSLNAVFITEEEVSLDQNAFTDNVEIESGNVFQGSITPNSTITFEVENSQNLIAVVDHGFGLDLSVPDNTDGALIQFKNQDGDLADSYIQIERFPETNDMRSSIIKSTKSKFSPLKSKNEKSNLFSNRSSSSQWSFDIDFSEEITAGQICFNVHIYDNNDNISAGFEICATINNYGGGPSGLIGKWRYVSYVYIEDGVEITEPFTDLEEDDYIIECVDYDSGTEENDYTYESFGHVPYPNDFEHNAYIVFHENGDYEDLYESIIPSQPEIIGSFDNCIEDWESNCNEYESYCEDLDLLNYIGNFYPTTITNTYLGKWSYDEDSNTIGIWDYSFQSIDSEGDLFDEEEDVYDEPSPYYDNGTLVEIDGNTLTLTEYNSWDDSYHKTIFERVD